MRENSKSERLFCLDALRGLDMLLLTVVGPFFMAVNKGYGLPEGVLAQFRHPWGGFTLWDIIMPLFIFMCGAAVPFGLGGTWVTSCLDLPSFGVWGGWRQGGFSRLIP